jgi:hypothetical protein
MWCGQGLNYNQRCPHMNCFTSPLKRHNISKVMLSLCLTIKHYAMKAYGGVDVYIHIFLISALVGGEWSPSRPGLFTPGERAPCTHWIGGWVGPRAGLDDVEKRKFLTLPGLELQPLGRPACRHFLYRIRYPSYRGRMLLSEIYSK